MPSHHAVPSFSVIPGQQVHTVLTGAEKQVVELVEAGYTGEKEPWDAFWGQRYAIVQDPDGNGVDLFAPLGE